MPASSNGWTSARGELGDRRLHSDGKHYSVNVSRTVSELVMRNDDAPRERRWTSILIDNETGEVSVGRGSDNGAAYKAAKAA